MEIFIQLLGFSPRVACSCCRSSPLARSAARSRWSVTSRSPAAREESRRCGTSVEPAIMAGDFDKAREITGKEETALSRLLGTGLARAGRRPAP